MPVWTEVLRDRTMGRKKTLGLPGRLKALHVSLSLPGRLVEVLRTIIQIPKKGRGGEVALRPFCCCSHVTPSLHMGISYNMRVCLQVNS